MKFETVQIEFLSDVFWFVVIQKFCCHINWHNEFSSLLRIVALVSRNKSVFHKKYNPRYLKLYLLKYHHRYLFCVYLPVFQVVLLK